MLTFTGADLGRLWHLNEASEEVRKSSIFVVCRCLSSVLEKIAPAPTGDLTPENLAPTKLPHVHPSRKLPPKIILQVFLFLILFYWVFVQSLKLISLNMFLFLIRIKFFYDSLFPYPVMLGFQPHIAKWPAIWDYWTE